METSFSLFLKFQSRRNLKFSTANGTFYCQFSQKCRTAPAEIATTSAAALTDKVETWGAVMNMTVIEEI